MTALYIGVYGASGFGKEVMPLARQKFPTLSKDDFVFIDDGQAGAELNGYAVLSYAEFLAKPGANKAVTIAIANSQIREKLVNRLTEDQIQHLDIQAANTGCKYCYFR